MTTPKANNDHFFRKKHEILQTGIYSSEDPTMSRDLTKIARISSIFRLQGPIPAPSQMKNIQPAEIRLTPAITHGCSFCYIVGLGLNCKFIDLLFKRLVITFIRISFLNDFIV